MYKMFRHPPYGHMIKLHVCGARRSPPKLPKFAEMLLENDVAFVTP